MMRAFNSAECARLIADLIAHMTLSEKAGQLCVYQLGDLSERSASDDLIRQLADGRIGTIRGVTSLAQADSLQEIATERSRLGIPLLFADETGTGFDTVMPTPFAAACSWDVAAIEGAERAVAAEAALRGLNWSLSPEVVFSDTAGVEIGVTLGTDIHLASEIAGARVRGLQATNSETDPGVLASLDLSSVIRERRDGPGRGATAALGIAEHVIRDGDLGVLAFDRLNGQARVAMEEAFDFLRGPGGFSGIILSEWESLAAAAEGVVGRIGFENLSVDALITAVQSGRLPKAQLDDAVARVLRAKFALGLFGAALGVGRHRSDAYRPSTDANRAAAQTLAERAIVLLRNRDGLLPLGRDAGDVLVVGTAAGDRQQALAGQPGSAASVIDGLEALGVQHKYVAGLALRGEGIRREAMVEADRMAITMASEAAKRAARIVVVLGEGGRGPELGEAQRALLEALQRANQNIILVTISSEPMDPVIADSQLPCILHAGQLGTMSGHAIAAVLAGRVSPGGKLPLNLPGSDDQAGLPFGHGLSYAEFELTAMTVEDAPRALTASAVLHNAGQHEGTETVQLYVSPVDAAGKAYGWRLAGFQKAALEPGQTRQIQFSVDANAVGRYLPGGRFVVEPGEFALAIGLSSAATLRTRAMVSPELARAMVGLSPTVTPFRRRA